MGVPAIAPYAMPAAEDVPENIAQWRFDPGRAVLLVHDMQRYFLSPFTEGAAPRTELVRNCAALRGRCAELGVPVVYTAQPGGMSESERGLLKDFWGPGMTVEPADREVVDELAPAPGDVVFTKWRYSAFHRTGLLELLRDLDRDQLVICGVYAHVGCLMTACEAFSHDVQPFLVADAVADFSSEYHRMALRYAAERCAATPTTAALLSHVDSQMVTAGSGG
ncbi:MULTISPECIES: isochorismatase family protein [Actinomycetes]|uniref:isochorismatase family protein n=1 Tax=Streptomyces sp. AA4 TaxID=591158 RepID=UPI0001B586BB|nr:MULTISPECIES: isochorismatase family protein [Actinomycetes]